jgi:hypothetical protein
MASAHTRNLIALTEVGSINELLISKYSAKLGMNEGNFNYFTKVVPVQMNNVVTGVFQDFTIPLTDLNHDITEFQRSYVTLHLQIEITFENGMPFLDAGAAAGFPNWPRFGQNNL